jgi:hypothetical protein
METRDIEVPTSKIIDFIKTKRYLDFNKIYISRFEETGKPDCHTWIEVFDKDEIEILKDRTKFPLADNADWPTFFLFKTIEYSKQMPIFSKNPDKHFLTMNTKLNHHRCYIMDELNFLGLLEKNEYTWHADNCKNIQYNWKSNLKTRKLQETYFHYDCNSCYHVPESEFQSTAFNLVMESQCNNSLKETPEKNIVFLTEKTFIPIIHKKPCIILGNWKHWRTMQKYGFKSYPFINYEFDDVKDNDIRMNLFLVEIQRICNNYSPKDIEILSKEICEFNYNHLYQMYQDKVGVPEWLLDVDRF